MKNLLVMLGWGPESSAEERKLLLFADRMGVSTKRFSIGDFVPPSNSLDECAPGTYSLAISAGTLAALSQTSNWGSNLKWLTDGSCIDLLVFDCSASPEHKLALSLLTNGAVVDVKEIDGPRLRLFLPSDAAGLSRQLAGLHFSTERKNSAVTFGLQGEKRLTDEIVVANERPIFVRLAKYDAHIFILGGPLPDIHSSITCDRGVAEHYESLIPLLIFFKSSFPDGSWQSSRCTARFMIDDLLLCQKYGFVEYTRLLEAMRRTQFGTSVAFIPWNHWRTSREDVSRLFDENANLSICIHGCDHSNREFNAQDPELLEAKAALAVGRMECQKRRIGLAFEKIMIFPQGFFSSAAIPGLRSTGYFAAVNSTCFPTDSGIDDLDLGDFLWPAITRYSGFPIFNRRYPRSVFDLLFDLFLGKPALLVEHHEYFRQGTQRLEEFVQELRRHEPNLSWPSLTSQFCRSHMRRNISEDSVEVRFFTRKLKFRSRESRPTNFIFRKDEPDPSIIKSVLVDGEIAPFSVENGLMKLEVEMKPGQTITLEIRDLERTAPLSTTRGFGLAHNAGVFLRRGLSEFRDNTLARHSGLMKVAKGIAKGLRVTGDS
jgi:hypothetical protein